MARTARLTDICMHVQTETLWIHFPSRNLRKGCGYAKEMMVAVEEVVAGAYENNIDLYHISAGYVEGVRFAMFSLLFGPSEKVSMHSELEGREKIVL